MIFIGENMELNYSGSGIIYYNKDKYKCGLYINKNCGGIHY